MVGKADRRKLKKFTTKSTKDTKILKKGANQLLVGSPRRGNLGRLGEPSCLRVEDHRQNPICAF